MWETLYSGTRGHYALSHGRVFPVLGRRGITISAISGVDCALWDILGKSLGVPVWRLLGGRRSEKMPAYASGGWAGPDKIGDELMGYVKRGGFGAVKMRVGIIDGEPRHSARRVHAAREALGPDIGLMCDAHGTLSVAEAKRFCRLVEEDDFAWFEEPVTADDKAGCAEVRRCHRHPDRRRRERVHPPRFPRSRGAGRGRHHAARSRDLRRHHRGDADFGDRQRLTISSWRRICGPARRPFAAGLAVAAASPAGFIVEYSLGANPLLHDLVEEDFPVSDGMIEVPERPGLGITVREDFLQKHAFGEVGYEGAVSRRGRRRHLCRHQGRAAGGAR